MKKYLFFSLFIVGLMAVNTTQSYASEPSIKETKEYINKNKCKVEKNGKLWSVYFLCYEGEKNNCTSSIQEIHIARDSKGDAIKRTVYITKLKFIELDLEQTIANGDTITFVPKLGKTIPVEDPEKKRWSDKHRVSIKCDSPERAKRVLKAYKHLAKLCGNIPEKDPFAD